MTMRKLMTMRAFLEDPRFGGSEDMLGGDSWRSWRIVLVAAMGETLTEDERETFKALTGRDQEPGVPVEELTAVVGRRGEKAGRLPPSASIWPPASITGPSWRRDRSGWSLSCLRRRNRPPKF